MAIWCVEDDDSVRDIELYTLRSTGFDAEGFCDAASFRSALCSDKPELIILDIMLPGEDGLDLLRFLRSNQSTQEIPIIMATAKGQEYDKVQSLDLGADDYLVKPFGMMEMVSRVKAVMRRYKSVSSPRLLKSDGVVVNLDEYTVSVDGEKILLTHKEFELLRLFLTHPKTAFTREQLFSKIWGFDFVGETRTVDMHIRTLRQKLGNYGKGIVTVRNVGYRWEINS